MTAAGARLRPPHCAAWVGSARACWRRLSARMRSSRRRSRDGVIWVTIGREAKSLIPQMREIGKALEMILHASDTPEASINRLRTLL